MHYEYVVVGSSSLLVVAGINSECHLGYLRKDCLDGRVMVQGFYSYLIHVLVSGLVIAPDL